MMANTLNVTFSKSKAFQLTIASMAFGFLGGFLVWIDLLPALVRLFGAIVFVFGICGMLIFASALSLNRPALVADEIGIRYHFGFGRFAISWNDIEGFDLYSFRGSQFGSSQPMIGIRMKPGSEQRASLPLLKRLFIRLDNKLTGHPISFAADMWNIPCEKLIDLLEAKLKAARIANAI